MSLSPSSATQISKPRDGCNDSQSIQIVGDAIASASSTNLKVLCIPLHDDCTAKTTKLALHPLLRAPLNKKDKQTLRSADKPSSSNWSNAS